MARTARTRKPALTESALAAALAAAGTSSQYTMERLHKTPGMQSIRITYRRDEPWGCTMAWYEQQAERAAAARAAWADALEAAGYLVSNWFGQVEVQNW